MIKFVEVVNETEFNSRLERTAVPRFTLSELWVNEDTIVTIREATGYKKLLRASAAGEELHEDHSFTSLTLNNCGIMETHVVVGAPSTVASRLNKETRTLLKG
jgi:hypothetical protein